MRNQLSGEVPRVTGRNVSRQPGFTIVELMITIGIVAIITSLALPSYRTIIEKRQVTSGAEQIGAFLSAAQLEAVRRNEFVAVAFKDLGTNDEGDKVWCLIMSASTDLDRESLETVPGGNSCAADDVLDPEPVDPEAGNTAVALSVFNSSALNAPNVLDSAMLGGDNGYFIFDPIRGTVVAFPETTELQLISDRGNYAMNIQVTPTGRVKLCSDETRGTVAVPGFGTCG